MGNAFSSTETFDSINAGQQQLNEILSSEDDYFTKAVKLTNLLQEASVLQQHYTSQVRSTKLTSGERADLQEKKDRLSALILETRATLDRFPPIISQPKRKFDGDDDNPRPRQRTQPPSPPRTQPPRTQPPPQPTRWFTPPQF